MRKVSFHQNRTFWRLNPTTGTSRELTTWPNWNFCPIVLQLSWPFNSLACFTRVPLWWLASHESVVRFSRETPLIAHILSFLHTLHTQLLHKSHLNTGYLIAKSQANLARNKTNTWLNKFNLTIINGGVLK